MDSNPLHSITNSPPLVPAFHIEQYRKQTTNLWSSEESYRSSLIEIKEDIYNAERVVPDDQTVDDTDIICPPSHTPQIDLPICIEQDDCLSRQGVDATSRASEFVVTVTEGQDAREVERSQNMLGNDRHARLHYSEPSPNRSRSLSIDCQSRSCKSLDCLKSGYNGLVTPKSWVDRSSPSSEEALASVVCTFLFPLSPCRPPIARRSTPPGLPTFGTREAQELRLTLASQSKLANIGRRILRYISADNPATQPREDDQSAAPIGAHQQQMNVPADMLKRILGIARPVSVSVGAYEPGRSKLPKGIKIAATTGALIQADDGTYVKGRWGPRTSGHGIGQRTIGAHPLARLRESSAIDDAVREIDKVHGREQLRARRALPRDLSLALGQSEVSNTHIYSPDGRSISEYPLRTSTMPNVSSTKRYAHLGHTSMPSQSSYQMIEPNRYLTPIRPDRTVDTNGTRNSPESERSRNTGGAAENQVATSLLQICWEWTCRPCSHFFFPDMICKSSGTRNNP